MRWNPRRRGPPLRQPEAGAVLVLAMLVMLILAVVVMQLFYSTAVELRLAENLSLELQMEAIAHAGLRKAESVLILDLEDDRAAAEGDSPDGGAGPGGGGLTDPGDAPGADGGGETAPHVDSLDEDWAMAEIPFELGMDQELTAKIFIEDEDGKLNVLLLGTEDEDYRREWRERFMRALDYMRDGKKRDLSNTEARDFLERVEQWMEGDRGGKSELSVPPLATEMMSPNTQRPFYAPLTLDELALVGSGDPTLFTGFPDPDAEEPEDDSQERREWILGLRHILTVWTNLELAQSGNDEQPPGAGSEPPADDGGDSGADGAGGGDGDVPAGPPEEAEGVNNGRINVNTAPIANLRSLIPEQDLPASAWDEYEEFRSEKLKAAREQLDEFLDPDEEEQRMEEEERFRDENPDAPIYPLQTVDDLRRFEAFSESNSYLSPDVWDLLRSLLTVESNVFTITVVVGTSLEPRRYYIARSVVWRLVVDDGARVIPVLPFERLAPGEFDLQDFNRHAREWSEEFGRY